MEAKYTPGPWKAERAPDLIPAEHHAEDTAKSLRRIFGLPDQDPING